MKISKTNIEIKQNDLTKAHSNFILEKVNNHCVRLALNDKSTFEWCNHKNSDIVIFVLEGELEINFFNKHKIILKKLDSIMIPKGVSHKIIVKRKTINLCFEKFGTLTTSLAMEEEVGNDHSVINLQKVNFNNWYNSNRIKKHKNDLIWNVNDHCVRFAINSGEYQTHNHPNSDEIFILIYKSVLLQLSELDIELNEMDILSMPKGLNHKPIAKSQTGIVFFESMNYETIFE